MTFMLNYETLNKEDWAFLCLKNAAYTAKQLLINILVSDKHLLSD